MRPLLAISLKLLSVLLFITMAALVKAASTHVGVGQSVFFRSCFALPIVISFLALNGELKTALRTAHPIGHIWRGVLGTAGMLMGFASLALLPLPEANAIGFAAPLFTVLFAAWLLGERLRVVRSTAVLIGLIGVLIITIPQFRSAALSQTLALGAAFGLGSAVFWAISTVTVRYLVKRETPSSIVFYFSLISAFIGLITLPLGLVFPEMAWVWPDWTAAMYLMLAGGAGGIAQLAVTTAYKWAEMGVLAPFDYTSLLFAGLIGYFVFQELPAPATYWGAPLVVLAGLIIIYRERQLGLERAKAAQTGKPSPV